MVLRFMTKRSVNGHRRYLQINTTMHTYMRDCPKVMPWDDAVEVSGKALSQMTEQVRADHYMEVMA